MGNQHCSAAENAANPATNHCDDHSGQLTYMRGITALLVFAAGLLSYSVFWQAPSIAVAIAKEVARVEGEIKLVKKDMETLSSSYSELRTRVDDLEKRSPSGP